jgi:hypothetical protein
VPPADALESKRAGYVRNGTQALLLYTTDERRLHGVGTKRAYVARMDVAPIVRTAYDPNGFLCLQIDYGGTDDAASHLLEVHHTYGFVSRPRDADGKGGASAFVLEEGDVGHAILSYDPRDAGKAPQLEPGSAAMYSATGAFVHLDGASGDLTVYVPAPGGGGAHLLTLSQGTGAVTFAHAEGMAVIMYEKTLSLRSDTGKASLHLKGGDVTVVGNLVVSGVAPVGGVPTFVTVPILDALGKIDTALALKLAPTPPIFTTPPPGYITPPN